MISKIKKCFLSSLLIMSVGTCFAQVMDCPSAQEFQAHFLLPPFSYQPQKNELKFGSISTNGKMMENGNWFLVLKSLKATPDANHEEIVKDVISQLENVNTNAYRLSSSLPELSLSYCMYRSTAHPHIGAIAYFIPEFDDGEMNIQGQQPKQKPINHLMKILALK